MDDNIEQKSASPSLCSKGVDCNIVSRDNNPNVKIVLDENAEQKSSSPSSCRKGIDCDIVSRDNNPNGKIILDKNVEQKSASPSSCCKGVDCNIVSHDNNPNGKIVLYENSSEHALAETLWPSKVIFPNKENNLDPNYPSLEQISASASSSQLISWGSKPSYYSISCRHSQQTSVSISNVDLGDSQTALRSSCGSKDSQTNVSWQTSAKNLI